MARQHQPDADAPEEPSSLRRLAWLLRPHIAILSLTLVLQLLLALVNMTVPLFVKVLLDDVFPHGRWDLLALILGGVLAVYATRNVLFYYAKACALRIGEDVAFALRNRLFDAVQRMSMRFYRQNKAGEVSNRVMGDSQAIQSFIQDELSTLLQAVFRFVCLIAIVFAINWRLALASTMVLPWHMVAFMWFKRPIKESGKVAQRHLDAVHGGLIEKFLAIELVKSFVGEERESQTFEKTIDLSRESERKSKTYHVLHKVVADLLVGLGTIALLGYGAYQVMGPTQMKPGTFMAFFSFVLMLYPTVLELMAGFAKFTRTTTSIDRVWDLIHPPDTRTEETPTHARPLHAVRGEVRFENVSFGYDDGSTVLQNVSFHLPVGRTLAVVGQSGAGKSTLINLLPRFIEPSMGRILFDGHDIKTLDVRHLRGAIGVAFQDCLLFNTTIYENLRYARPGATRDEVIDIARRTGAHEFISKLTDGYDTVIGEGGVSLSRGQKQRISLVRALLKNPRVLILDEATSSLDAASESQVIPAILEFMKGKTTLMVTHRPELLRHADSVIELQDGRVIFHGPPGELPVGWTSGSRSPMLADDPSQPVGPIPLRIHAKPTQDDHGSTHHPQRRRDPFKAGMWWLAASMLISGLIAGQSVLAADENPAGKPTGKPAVAPGPTQQAPSAQPAKNPPTVPPAPKPAKPEVVLPQPKGGRFIPLPGVTQSEAVDLLATAVSGLCVEQGYSIVSTDTPTPFAKELPEGLEDAATLVKNRGSQRVTLLLAYRASASQPIHVCIMGQADQPGGTSAADADVDDAAAYVRKAIDGLNTELSSATVDQLKTYKVRLSFVETQRCLDMLKVFGYTVNKPGEAVNPKKLPVIVPMPQGNSTNLPPGKDKDFPLTDSDPINELLIFYHPSRPAQYSAVLDTIRNVIDVPARQIMIEAMVLEISETGLKRLGVEWELQSPSGSLDTLTIGRLPSFATSTNEVPTLDVGLENLYGNFRAKLQALIRDGSAEVLSRPSVLTLDNRMAYISVIERIPVVASLQNPRSDIVTVNFTEKVAGITLNVRPRVSYDNQEVSMQVVAQVAARVPNADVVVRNSQGDEVARSPTISEREVRTFTRVANNTPFIIGGLISHDQTLDTDKVPLLGDIPLVGPYLFTNTRSSRLKREVIIVLTPYVMPETRLAGRNLPKDEDMFDSFDNRLFRDAYRIRAEDVFDLSFLLDNRQLRRARRIVEIIASRNADLAGRYPFRHFADSTLPGERVLVYRQMYEVIKRRKVDEKIDMSRVIYFKADPSNPSGFSVSFLEKDLAKMLDLKPGKDGSLDPDAFDAAIKGKAVEFVYTMQRYDADPERILKQPVPEVKIVDCPDEAAWSRMLWELNQPGDDGRDRHTFIIRNSKDLTRLRRAMVLKRTVELNASRSRISLDNFSVGRLLLIPEFKNDQVNLADEQTAQYFFNTEQYYPVVKQELSRDVEALFSALKLPEVRALLEDHEDLLNALEWQP